VLLIQDTTSFDFSHHAAAAGMGPMENEYCRGFFAHSTLGVSTDGVPLGLLGQQVWARLLSHSLIAKLFAAASLAFNEYLENKTYSYLAVKVGVS